MATAIIAVLHRYLPVASLIPAPWHYVGVAFAALGVFLTLWSVALFRRVHTTIIPFQESSALITSGPYRYTRNPIYLAMALLLLGAAVFAGSLSPFLVIPAFMVLIQKLFISPEEAMLAERFGTEYTSYSTRVRRWL